MFLDFIYPLFWFLLIFLGLRYVKFFRLEGLKNWDLSIGFLVKILSSVIFIFIFSNFYGTNGILNIDPDIYFYDGYLLNNIFYESKTDYFKLLFGLGENQELVEKYLGESLKWNYSYSYLYNDGKNLIKINSLIHFISFNNIYVHFIFFNCICFAGICLIYISCLKFINIKKRYFYFLLIFFPSLLLWGSAILKESIVIFGLGILVYSIFCIKPLKMKIVLLLCSSFILLLAKPYILIILLIVTGIILLKKIIPIKNYLLYFSLVLCFVLGYLVIFESQRSLLVRSISFKQHDFINLGRGGVFIKDTLKEREYNISPREFKNLKINEGSIKILKPTHCFEVNRYIKIVNKTILDTNSKNLVLYMAVKGTKSYIPVTPIKTSFKQLIFNIPEALINSLLRPLPGDSGSNFKYFAIVETILIVVFSIFSVIHRRKIGANEKIFVFALLLFALLISLLVGWTTPILGAIVRYRIPSYLAILIICTIIIEPPAKWKKEENIS